jgi:hypothetical protein
MSSIRDASSAEHDPLEAFLPEPVAVPARRKPFLPEPVSVPAILKPSDTRLIVVGFGICAILVIVVTCL